MAKTKPKILWLVVVSFPYEGGWLIGIYDKKSTAKRIKSISPDKKNAKIIPMVLNQAIKGNDRYI